MIVVLKRSASPEQIDHVCKVVEELGLRSHPIYGAERTVVAAVGVEKNPSAIKARLESMEVVEQVLPILAPYKIASRELQGEPTLIRTGSFEVGGVKLAVIAGPCSVESREQILAIARAVRDAGATALRGGAFKPRTSPYSFQGLKDEGLRLLVEAREETGLAIVTEVMSPAAVSLVSEHADILQIGARNMQNYDLLAESGMQSKPVLLKRGPSATVDEFLLAAEYILDRGNRNVILCERGIRTFESHVRFTLPLAIIPYLKERTHLPVMIDPSHGTGVASLVPSMAKAAIAAGADGLIVEVHTDPERSWSDGAQTLSTAAFETMMADCRRVAQAVDRTIV
ncbi:3-deoxy-7-phosphoheptulonate synthase [bacterium]|jgi:3-deoxy-7-phosphoheptulonate synthase|nr:3-deoxy-7-phosphoheptulonate synthase [bacterium]